MLARLEIMATINETTGSTVHPRTNPVPTNTVGGEATITLDEGVAVEVPVMKGNDREWTLENQRVGGRSGSDQTPRTILARVILIGRRGKVEGWSRTMMATIVNLEILALDGIDGSEMSIIATAIDDQVVVNALG